MIYSVALTTGNGSQLVAEGGGGAEVLANRGGIGPWETFRLFNRTHPGAAPQHGDAVVLQVWSGRFIIATAAGSLQATQGWIDSAAEFTMERVAGAGTITSGDQLALRAHDGRFVVAENNGGGVVNANRARRGPWETFSITVIGEQLVRLRSESGRYMTAEGGGGRQVTANRSAIGLWETFSLLNFTRAGQGTWPGDVVALRTWNGSYLRVLDRDQVDATANQARDDARFRVVAAGAGPLRHRQRVTFQSLSTSDVLADDAGTIGARDASPASHTRFSVERADRQGIQIGWLQSGASLAGRPFDPPPAPVPSPRDVLTLHFFERPGEPVTTSARLRRAITGPAPSLAAWLGAMSGGAFGIRDVGVHGPFFSVPVPDPDAADAHRIGHDSMLTGAEASGVPLAALAEGGIIDSGRVALVHIKAGAVGGQVHDGSALSQGGIRFVGRDAGVGVTPEVDEASRAVLCHEASHLVLDVRDRYGSRQPIRGDLIANRRGVGGWEPLVMTRVAGAGPISSGEVVTLRAHNGSYLAVDAAPPNLVNIEPVAASRAQRFVVMSSAGGAIAHGSRIGFRTTTGRWLTAELGSDGVVTANRTARRSWETFEALRLDGDAGPIASGDRVYLKSAAGLFISAAVGGRSTNLSDADRRRGYQWGGSTGTGQGGGFDNADANYSTVMLSVYDRIRLGWVRPRYLTPDNRGCFVIRPFLDSRDALILFDPQNPLDWYTVENRQFRDDVDEVPSSGLVISWVREDDGYWQWWLHHSNDDEDPSIGKGLAPAVISAAAPAVPPNMLARPVVFDHAAVTKRNDSGAAFVTGELVLPLGSGDPSRFHVTFHTQPSDAIALCVH